MLRTHCCRHKRFPVCPRAQHLLRTQILCPGHKNVSDFVQKHFVSAANVSQFAQPKKHHGQQCVRNNVSSFTRALTVNAKPTKSLTFVILSRRNVNAQRVRKVYYVSFELKHSHYSTLNIAIHFVLFQTYRLRNEGMISTSLHNFIGCNN